LPSAEVG